MVGVAAEAAAADCPRHHQAGHDAKAQLQALVGMGVLNFLAHHHGTTQQAAAAGPQHRPPAPGGQVAAAQNRAPGQQQGRQKGGGQGGQVARHSVGEARPHQDPQQLLEVAW